MKFQCGKTRDEKREAVIRKVFNWHLVFAWLPIKIGKHDCRWLEYVECRRYFDRSNLGRVLLSEVIREFVEVFPDEDWDRAAKVEYAQRGTYIPLTRYHRVFHG